MVVFSRDTYNHLATWVEDARSSAHQNIIVALLGNKCDLSVSNEILLFFPRFIVLGIFKIKLLFKKKYYWYFHTNICS